MLVKRSSVNKKLKERKALTLRIKRTGFKMFPCSFCEKSNTKYVVSDKENSSRCLECVLCKAKCNAKGILVSE
jgi:transcription elongation factor Elf1